ncbi:hypothetical protein HOO54_02865 [Bacillus sp. WMMC1349]|uniref:phage tail terminator protein n=1 Tax=Bacillus sp. WMMC1349 TaxID=2736254 RepID=UPI0015563B62|nr:minor capsid protein [Bacillus sp. WMMC1349]NPC91221.1 hypothetical protein [Bacillus sp. WMMC1349]
MDFLERIKQYIETNVLFDQALNVGPLKNGNSMSIRPTSGSQSVKSLDLGRSYTFPFQILVRHQESRTGYKTCQEIANKLDALTNGAVTSHDGSFDFIKCDLYTTPNWVERTPDGDIYTALFQAEIYIKGVSEVGSK